MEKMKCSSCGGEVVIGDDKEYGKCSYCGTKYKLKKDVNLNIKIDDNSKEILNKGVKHFSIFLIIPIIIFIIIFVIVIFNIFQFNNKTINKNTSENINNISDSFNDFFSKKLFNGQFYGANGTNSDFFVQQTLDDIIESNKTYDRKITLEYEDKVTSNEDEIIEIKHSLNGDYEVYLNYDEEGFINKIIIKKILN